MVTGWCLPQLLGEEPTLRTEVSAWHLRAGPVGQIPFLCIVCNLLLGGGRGARFPQYSGTVNILAFALAVVLPLLRHMKESLVYWGESLRAC